MIITCPECAAQFAVPAGAIKEGGKKVKCSKCQHVWLQQPLNDLAPPEKIAEIQEPPEEVTPIPHHSSLPVIQEKVSLPVGLIAACIILLFFTILTFALTNREQIPALSNVYAMLGMGKTDGLIFESITAQRELVGNQYEFTIEGEITNISDEPRDVPDIVATIYTKADNVLNRVYFTPEKRRLSPGESLDFNPMLSNISRQADHIALDIGNGWERFFR